MTELQTFDLQLDLCSSDVLASVISKQATLKLLLKSCEIGLLPGFSADTTKLVTEVNIKIISHNMINLPHDHFSYGVPNPGKFTISNERSKCLAS